VLVLYLVSLGLTETDTGLTGHVACSGTLWSRSFSRRRPIASRRSVSTVSRVTGMDRHGSSFTDS